MKVPQEFIPLNGTAFDVKAFDCGKPKMNEFLARYAVKHMGKNLSMTWVLPAEFPKIGEKAPVAAYYTLATSTIAKDDVPDEAKLGGLPGYPVPVVMLARLAVNINHQGKGYGQKVLVSALRHAVQMTEPPHHLPAIAVVLDILDEDAKGFYDKFDMFHEMCENPMKLFVPMNALRQI